MSRQVHGHDNREPAIARPRRRQTPGPTPLICYDTTIPHTDLGFDGDTDAGRLSNVVKPVSSRNDIAFATWNASPVSAHAPGATTPEGIPVNVTMYE